MLTYPASAAVSASACALIEPSGLDATTVAQHLQQHSAQVAARLSSLGEGECLGKRRDRERGEGSKIETDVLA